MSDVNPAKPVQIPMDFGGRRAFGFEDFMLGPSNQDAVSWIDRWPNWPAPALIISGPAASGKTHLSAVWKEKTKAEIIPPKMLITRDAGELAMAGENLVIDGVDPWLGAREAEETLFHLYNILKEEQRSMLLTMRMVPVRTVFTLPDLASRLRAAPMAEISPPDDILLASILIKLFSDRQLVVGNDVMKYLLPRMERSFSAAREIVVMADRMALSGKQKISVPLMRKVLSELQGGY